MTLFPRTWDSDSRKPVQSSSSTNRLGSTANSTPTKEAPTRQSDPLDVFDQIFQYLNVETNKADQYKTSFKLACLLIDRCAENIVDEKLTPEGDRKYIEYYNRYIDELMNEQKNCLEDLSRMIAREMKAGADSDDDASYFGIAREVKILKEVRDVHEELDIMLNVIKKQHECLNAMHHEYRHKGDDGQHDSNKSLLLPGRSGMPSISNRGHARRPEEQSQSQGTNGRGNDDDDRPMQATQQERLDPTLRDLQKLLNKSDGRRRILEDLQKKAQSAKKSIQHLLDLKQRQENVQQARLTAKLAKSAERQGEAVMVFTVVTIVFLPLTSVASIYGMNAAEFGQGEVKLTHIFRIMFPVSAAVAMVILYLAFARGLRQIIVLLIQIIWVWLKHRVDGDQVDSREEKPSWEKRLEKKLADMKKENEREKKETPVGSAATSTQSASSSGDPKASASPGSADPSVSRELAAAQNSAHRNVRQTTDQHPPRNPNDPGMGSNQIHRHQNARQMVAQLPPQDATNLPTDATQNEGTELSTLTRGGASASKAEDKDFPIPSLPSSGTSTHSGPSSRAQRQHSSALDQRQPQPVAPSPVPFRLRPSEVASPVVRVQTSTPVPGEDQKGKSVIDPTAVGGLSPDRSPARGSRRSSRRGSNASIDLEAQDPLQ